jgi:diaminopimelate epimerase
MREYRFRVFRPGGNDTALVPGLDFDKKTRAEIDAEIRREYPFVEQVGFVGKNNDSFRLEMAGGEFCGNAARCAANYFLNNLPGEIEISVSGVTNPLKAGVKKPDTAWTAIPAAEINSVSVADEGMYLVRLEGIVHLVILPRASERFLSEAKCSDSFQNKIKSIARTLMDKYRLLDNPACGVMFLEQKQGVLLLHPCVLVPGIESSMYYETACGSGTAAVTMAYAFRKRTGVRLSIIQPSEYAIESETEINGDNRTLSAYINGTAKKGEIITRRLEK